MIDRGDGTPESAVIWFSNVARSTHPAGLQDTQTWVYNGTAPGGPVVLYHRSNMETQNGLTVNNEVPPFVVGDHTVCIIAGAFTRYTFIDSPIECWDLLENEIFFVDQIEDSNGDAVTGMTRHQHLPNGSVAFIGSHTDYGQELFTWNGDRDSLPQVLLDAEPGTASSSPSNLVRLGDSWVLCFSARVAGTGSEPHCYNALTGVHVHADIKPGSSASSPTNFVGTQDGRYGCFSARGGDNKQRAWCMDTQTGNITDASTGYAGQQAETISNLVADGDGGGPRASSGGRPWFLFEGRLGGSQSAVMTYDPETQETFLMSIEGGQTLDITDATGLLGGVIMTLNSGGSSGREAYFWNGTHGSGAQLVADIKSGTGHSTPEGYNELNATHAVFFATESSFPEMYLWRAGDWGQVTKVPKASAFSRMTDLDRMTVAFPGTVLFVCNSDEYSQEPCIARFPLADGIDPVADAIGLAGQYPAGSPYEVAQEIRLLADVNPGTS